MKSPPQLLQWLINWVCPDERRDIAGDLLEIYHERVESSSALFANFKLFIQLLTLIPLRLMTVSIHSPSNPTFMLRNYLIIASRNLRKDKTYALLNIAGLAVGIAVTILIFTFIRFELSYDNFHEKGEQIHRVQHIYSFIGAPIGPTMKDRLPEVEDICRINNWAKNVKITLPDNQYFKEDILLADENFFDFFSFKLLNGNPQTILQDPNNVIISEFIARKYFGEENAVGKFIEVENLIRNSDKTLKVVAVMENIPENSHLQFEMVTSLQHLYNEPSLDILDSWVNDWIPTYLQLAEGTNIKHLEQKYYDLFNEHTGANDSAGIAFMPLEDIHLHSSYLRADYIQSGNINHIRVFAVIAALVLLIGCINFMNLATAKSIRRSKEVGVRKVMGAFRSQLISQFITESFLISIIALIVASGLIYLGAFLLEQSVGIEFSKHLEWKKLAPLAILITLFTGLFAGSYPAFYLSSFKPATILRDPRGKGKKGAMVRKTLVIFQLTISTSLIIGTFIVIDQMNFIKNKELGFNTEQTLLLDYGWSPYIGKNWSMIEHDLLQIPGVKAASATRSIPGDNAPYWSYKFEGTNSPEGDGWAGYYVGPGFFETLDIELVKGRYFSPEVKSDSNGFMLNESAWQRAITEYGEEWQNPIGKTIEYYTTDNNGWQLRKRGEIVGVVKDFHFRSLHDEIEAVVIQQSGAYGDIMLKIDPSNIPEILATTEAKWSDWGSKEDFSYTFLDERFNDYYESESQFSYLLYIFCGMAIFIACLGLFGLASFTVEQRVKEIGIRKVLGASASQIFVMISSGFIKLVLWSSLIAFPLSWVFSQKWLESFAYKVDLNFLLFFGGLFIIASLTLITVSWQAIRASRSNPVNSLRSE